MSTAHPIRARNVRSGVLIVSDAAMLTLSDAQQLVEPGDVAFAGDSYARLGFLRRTGLPAGAPGFRVLTQPLPDEAEELLVGQHAAPPASLRALGSPRRGRRRPGGMSGAEPPGFDRSSPVWKASPWLICRSWLGSRVCGGRGRRWRPWFRRGLRFLSAGSAMVLCCPGPAGRSLVGAGTAGCGISSAVRCASLLCHAV